MTKKKAVAKKVVQKKAPVETATERQIRELREQMASQQSQIDALKQANADQAAKLTAAQQAAQNAESAASSASAKADGLSSSVSSNADSVTALSSSVTDLKSSTAGMAQTISDAKKEIADSLESPLAIHYKGVSITPVAFFAFEGVNRTRSINSDINTPFNTTPYPGAAQAHTTELNFSGRQSRVGALFQANTGSLRLAGYVEADFLGTGVTSNNNQSNSYVLRQRQIWGQATTKSGFSVTGGQMWSLVTETKTGVDNRTEVLPATIDPQYHVGFSWTRNAAIRFSQKAGIFTGALALENGQTVGLTNTNGNTNYFIGGAGTNAGLYNLTTNYTNNVAPDLVVKVTADPKGMGHYEIGGIARWFRDRYYPNATYNGVTGAPATPSVAGASNNTKVGGGFFANARFPVTHFADFGLHLMGGTGVGRYGTSQLADVTVHPDGTLEPIKNWQGLISLDTHPTKKLDVFFYAGTEYAQRTTYLSTVGASTGKLVGYAPVTSSNAGCGIETLPTSTGNGLAGANPYNPGTPANCLGATRVVQEGTIGFTYRAYNSPKYGRLQYQGAYSYLDRVAWTGVGGAPKATNGMVFWGMRYYIP